TARAAAEIEHRSGCSDAGEERIEIVALATEELDSRPIPVGGDRVIRVSIHVWRSRYTSLDSCIKLLFRRRPNFSRAAATRRVLHSSRHSKRRISNALPLAAWNDACVD